VTSAPAPRPGQVSYQNLAYSIIAELEDHPPGESQLIMRKELG
jgi:hypothetical protein